jgi:hypothetical protein
LYRFIRFFSQKLCICIALNDTFLSIAAQHWVQLTEVWFGFVRLWWAH